MHIVLHGEKNQTLWIWKVNSRIWWFFTLKKSLSERHQEPLKSISFQQLSEDTHAEQEHLSSAYSDSRQSQILSCEVFRFWYKSIFGRDLTHSKISMERKKRLMTLKVHHCQDFLIQRSLHKIYIKDGSFS